VSADVMTKPASEASPVLTARIAGVFYLLTFLTGGLSLAFGGKVIVSGDAAATAINIMAHVPAVQIDFEADVLVVAWYIAVTALFYVLFKPVNRTVSLLAAFFSLVGCAISGIGCLLDLAPLVVLGGDKYLNVFSTEQLQSLAYMFLKLNGTAHNIPLVFFGFYCLLIGYLVFKSTFMPRTIGVLMALAGLSWLTFLFPPLASFLYPFNLLPGIVGEGSLTVWLLVMGVNAQRWREWAVALN